MQPTPESKITLTESNLYLAYLLHRKNHIKPINIQNYTNLHHITLPSYYFGPFTSKQPK